MEAIHWEKYFVTIDGKEFTIEIPSEMRFLEKVRINGEEVLVHLQTESHSSLWHLRSDKVRKSFYFFTEGTDTVIFSNGWHYSCKIQDEKSKKLSELIQTKRGNELIQILAPMPGLLLKNLKSVGAKVLHGEPIAILSAMKMENEIRSHVSGYIEQVCIDEQSSVEKGTILVTIKSE